MRYQPDHKRKTHRRIVGNAARQFRAKGLNGPGLAAVMQAAGLTVGGFYKHFHGKEDLLAEAIEEGLREIRERLAAAARQAPAGEAWKSIVGMYLSTGHCQHPEAGCPLAALAPDIARVNPKLKRRFAALIQAHRDAMLPFMPGGTPAERRRNFIVLFASMIGAVSLARTMTETSDQESILHTVRDYLLQAF